MHLPFRNPAVASHVKISFFVMTRAGLVGALVSGLMFATIAWAQTAPATPDDTAKFLAGMPVSEGSPLQSWTQDPAAKQHAANFDNSFGKLEASQLSKIREWTRATLTSPQQNMFYMFGGPDFLYADAFFPNATTYVLSGLEPVGPIPDLVKMQRWSALQAQRSIAHSLSSVLTVSYFITVNMFRDLNFGPTPGTIPILYVFLARSGKTIHDVSIVHLDEQGVLQPGERTRSLAPARGVKIVFSGSNGVRKTLYFFSTNLSDERGKNIALLQFCRSLGAGDSFVKSASYLLHTGGFTQVRNFILETSASILQDDTGIPLAQFDQTKWELRPFGRYVMPIFPNFYQPKLAEFFQKSQPPAIDFGVGYRWRPNESNLMLAIRREGAPDVTASVPQVTTPSQPEASRQQEAAPRQPDAAPQPVARPRAAQRVATEPPPFPFFPFFLFGPPPQN